MRASSLPGMRRRPACPPTARMIRSARQRATVMAGERVGIGEMGGAEMLDEVDAVVAQLVGQMFLLEGMTGHSIAVGQDRLEVGSRRRPFEPEG